MREETIHCVPVLIVYRYILHLTPAFARHRVLHRADTLGSRQTSTRGVARTRPRPLGMSDYAEDQAMEVEALESILMEDMIRVDGSEGIDGATHAPCYQISVSALGDGEEEDPSDESQTARLGLVFSHTPNYPDEPPLLKCRSVKGLFDSELVAVHELLTKHAAESVGMAMIFDLVNEAREWMRTRAGVVDVVEETPEMLKQRLEEEAEARLRAMRATGTPVTPETFNAWVMRFEAERALARAKAGKDSAAAAKDDTKRVTGRRYFEERTAAQMAGEEGEEAEDDFEFSDDDFEDSSDDEDALVAFMREGASGAGDGRENAEGSDGDEDDDSE